MSNRPPTVNDDDAPPSPHEGTRVGKITAATDDDPAASPAQGTRAGETPAASDDSAPPSPHEGAREGKTTAASDDNAAASPAEGTTVGETSAASDDNAATSPAEGTGVGQTTAASDDDATTSPAEGTRAGETPAASDDDPATSPAEGTRVGETTAAPPVPAPDQPGEPALRLAEALVFSSAEPITARALSQILPVTLDPASVIEALRARYAGRGVELVDVGGGVQFRTAPDLAPSLRKIIDAPRRLTRVAMETLAIVAYHQPVTRPEIEQRRGTSLSQQTLESLLEANLIAPAGRRETPGRPTLWVTTPQFLALFGLPDLRSLPRREDLLLEPLRPADPASPEPAEEEDQMSAAGPSAHGGEAEAASASDKAEPTDGAEPRAPPDTSA